MANGTEQAKQPSLAASTARGAVPGVAAGLGIGASIMALLQGSPQVVAQIASWGPGLAVIGLGAWLAREYVPQAIGAAREMASSMGALSMSIQERFRQEDDVRIACRALAGQIERMSGKIDDLHAVAKAAAGGGQR